MNKATAGGVALALLLSSCARPAELDQATQTTRAAAKSTCPEAVLNTEIPQLDRELIPFSPTMLGVETKYGEGDKLVRVVSGGYLDDLFEAFDDLELSGTAVIRDSTAELLATDFLGSQVFVAVWTEESLPSPCGPHALISLGYTESEFAAMFGNVS